MANKIFPLSVKPIIFFVSLLLLIFWPTTVVAEPQIEVVSHTSYLESTEGLFTIIGEIQNIGDQPATNVYITATYYNADNEVISDLGGPIVDLDVLLPGRKSPFGSTDLTTDPQLIDHYSLDVSFTPCDPKPEKLEIISHSSTIDPYDGYMHIIGEVENTGDSTTRSFKEERGYSLARLPNTKIEVESIAEMFAPQEKHYLDTFATEGRAKVEGGKYRITKVEVEFRTEVEPRLAAIINLPDNIAQDIRSSGKDLRFVLTVTEVVIDGWAYRSMCG